MKSEKSTERKIVFKMLTTQANSYRGICEVLRSIYDIAYELDDDNRKKITELLIDAMIMSKKMNDRLIYYKNTYNDNTGSNGGNLDRLKYSGGLKKFRALRVQK